MDKKFAAWVITTGKSCSQPCFPRSLNAVFSHRLGIRKHRVIRALYQETQLQSHTLLRDNSIGMPSVTAAKVKLGGNIVTVLKNKHWSVAIDQFSNSLFILHCTGPYACVLLHRPICSQCLIGSIPYNFCPWESMA